MLDTGDLPIADDQSVSRSIPMITESIAVHLLCAVVRLTMAMSNLPMLADSPGAQISIYNRTVTSNFMPQTAMAQSFSAGFTIDCVALVGLFAGYKGPDLSLPLMQVWVLTVFYWCAMIGNGENSTAALERARGLIVAWAGFAAAPMPNIAWPPEDADQAKVLQAAISHALAPSVVNALLVTSLFMSSELGVLVAPVAFAFYLQADLMWLFAVRYYDKAVCPSKPVSDQLSAVPHVWLLVLQVVAFLNLRA